MVLDIVSKLGRYVERNSRRMSDRMKTGFHKARPIPSAIHDEIFVGLGGVSKDSSVPHCLEDGALTLLKIRDKQIKSRVYLPPMTSSPASWLRQLSDLDIPLTGEKPFSDSMIGRVKAGCRGISIFQGRLYCCAWGSIYELDVSSLKILRVLTHHWMSDLHDIYADENGILCCSTLMDALILYDYDARPIASLFTSETSFVPGETPIDKQSDMRWRGKLKRGSGLFHPNGIWKHNGSYIVSGRGYKGLIRVWIEGRSMNAEPLLSLSNGCHEGVIVNDCYVVNQTDDFNIGIFKISNGALIQNLYPMGKTNRRKFFYRGLAVSQSSTFLVGCSPHEIHGPKENSCVVEMDLAGRVIDRMDIGSMVFNHIGQPTIMSGGIAINVETKVMDWCWPVLER